MFAREGQYVKTFESKPSCLTELGMDMLVSELHSLNAQPSISLKEEDKEILSREEHPEKAAEEIVTIESGRVTLSIKSQSSKADIQIWLTGNPSYSLGMTMSVSVAVPIPATA